MAKVTSGDKAAYSNFVAKERANAAQAKSVGDILSPSEQRLLDTPHGRTLLSGGSVRAEDLDMQTRREMGLRDGQAINFKPQVLRSLAQLQQQFAPAESQVQGINPIASLADVVNTPQPAGQVMAQSTPVTDPIQTVKNIIARRTQPIRNQIMDFINPLRQPTDVIPTDQLQSGDLSLLQRVVNPEGRQRTVQQIIDAIKGLVPAAQPATLETELMKRLSAKSPELTKDTTAKGLKRFAGTGQVKLGSSTYQIDDSGRIIKVR